jgi:arylsulfatase A-like enzyme
MIDKAIAKEAAKAAAPRAAAALVALLGGLLAWRMGGGAEAPVPPPRPATAASASASTTPGDATPPSTGDGYEAVVRLVEIAKDARFEMTHSDATRIVMKAHWRQQHPPFFPATGEPARYMASVALRTSASETQWAMPLNEKGKAWAPDARIWNMNEGSFDQRESIVSTSPGTAAFHVTVPQGAKLTFAEGTLNATEEGTAFVVSVLDGRGVLHEAYRHVLPPSLARRWTEAKCDLSAYAGQNVELRLSTEAAHVTEEDKRAATQSHTSAAAAVPASEYGGPGNGRPNLDGGVVREDALATPSAPVALWGNPTILAKTKPRVPYNVVWFVIDALRPDVLASFHDDAEDAKKEAAPFPPFEALLPKIPGLTPEIDDLARRGVRFTSAYSVGSWTRPGTLAMLSGARSSELGIDTTAWMLMPAETNRFYTSDPPLLSLILRRQGVTTRAFVNNYFMVGYAPVGIDMGFERVDDHRYRTRDTLEITQDATQWIKENKDTRFFAFVNYNSPHEPYEPPAKHLDRIPQPPAGPRDKITRLYMGEAAKDDEAIGVVMRTLDEVGIRDKTIVVVTADHGETLSSAHTGTSGLDKMPIRYHHAVSNFEETTRVPIVMVLPHVLPENHEVKARARSIDIAPTVLDVLGLDPHPRMTGKTLVPLVKGQAEEERVVVSEGRGSKAILAGRWRLLVREGPARIVIQGDKTRETDVELYDLLEDPGERHDLAPKRPEIVAEMKARLDAALKNAPVAGASTTQTTSAPAATTPPLEALKPPTLHLRFAGGAQPRRVSGTITIGDAKTKPKTLDVQPVEIGRESFKIEGGKIDLALRTAPTAPIGLDIVVDPPETPISWELWLDDKPWPEEAVFGGPYGLLAPALRKGIATDEGRLAAHASTLPTIDARRDVGLFVARERRVEGDTGGHDTSDEGAEEMARLLKEWGYAHGSSNSNKKSDTASR